MPEVKLVKRVLSNDDIQVVKEKGGVFISQTQLEWAEWVKNEYARLQEFLKGKSREYGKIIK